MSGEIMLSQCYFSCCYLSAYLHTHNQQPKMFHTSSAAEIIVINQRGRCRKAPEVRLQRQRASLLMKPIMRWHLSQQIKGHFPFFFHLCFLGRIFCIKPGGVSHTCLAMALSSHTWISTEDNNRYPSRARV